MLNKNHMIIGKGAEQMSEPRIYDVVYLFYFLLMSLELMRKIVIVFATQFFVYLSFHEYVFSVVFSFLFRQ